MPSFGDELGRLIPHMRRFARALVRGHSSQVADDLVQETIVLATRAERIARGPHLRSWCFASLIRVHRHWEQTSSAPGGEYLPGARTVSPAYATAADGTLAFMPKEIARLDQLPLDEREVLLLTVLVGMSYAQVAETLHLTVETVLARLDLARTMLARGQKFTGFSVQGGGAGSLNLLGALAIFTSSSNGTGSSHESFAAPDRRSRYPCLRRRADGIRQACRVGPAMASDPDLRDRIDQWRRQNEALTATFGGVLREPVPLRLMPTNLVRERVVAREIAPTPIDRSRSHSSGRVLAVAVAAFLAGGGAMFSVGAMTSGPPSVTGARDPDIGVQSGARGLALRAYEAHRTFATDFAHPVEVSADDGPHLLKWLQHRLSLAIRLPDLRRQGWTLVGGRVLPGELAPAAFLIYANGVERVGLYIARTNARHADEVALYDNGAGLGSVGYWVDEPIGYALTTNRDSAWLDRDGADLIEAIKTQLRDNASAY